MPRDAKEELDEDPSEEDVERFSGVTRKCPDCATEVYDDAVVCWKCGSAMSSETRTPRWVILTAGAVLVLLLLWLLRAVI